MENNTTQLKKFTPETMKEIVYVQRALQVERKRCSG